MSRLWYTYYVMVKQGFVRMFIKGIVMDREKDAPMVLLLDKKNRYKATVEIGPFEANALIVELENIHMPRPLTHDIIAQLFRKHGFSVQFIELNSQQQDGFSAKLFYAHGGDDYAMEMRPSDAMVLAAKTGAALFVRRDGVRSCDLDDAPAAGAGECEEDEILFSPADDGHPKLM